MRDLASSSLSVAVAAFCGAELERCFDDALAGLGAALGRALARAAFELARDEAAEVRCDRVMMMARSTQGSRLLPADSHTGEKQSVKKV